MCVVVVVVFFWPGANTDEKIVNTSSPSLREPGKKELSQEYLYETIVMIVLLNTVGVKSLAQNSHPSIWWADSIVLNHSFRERDSVFSLCTTLPLVVLLRLLFLLAQQ